MTTASHRINSKVWQDERFKKLSFPNGQMLWLYLICNPNARSFPGLFVEPFKQMADAINILVSSVRAAFKEITQHRLAFIDQETSLVWVPNSLKYNHPNRPDEIIHWLSSASSFKRCELRSYAIATLGLYCLSPVNRGDGEWADAYQRALKTCFTKAEIAEIQHVSSEVLGEEVITAHEGYEDLTAETHYLKGYRQGIIELLKDLDEKSQNNLLGKFATSLRKDISISIINTIRSELALKNAVFCKGKPCGPSGLRGSRNEVPPNRVTEDFGGSRPSEVEDTAEENNFSSNDNQPKNQTIPKYTEADFSGPHNLPKQNLPPSSFAGEIESILHFPEEVRNRAREVVVRFSMRCYGSLPNFEKAIIKEMALIAAATIETHGDEAFSRWIGYFTAPPKDHPRNLAPWHIRKFLGLETNRLQNNLKPLGSSGESRKEQLAKMYNKKESK